MRNKPRPNIRKKFAILGILLLVVAVGAWYAQRLLSDRELHKGRTLLHDRDFDAAAGEFRRLVDSQKYHVKGRGLLLYSLFMEQKARRPLLAHTGVNAEGLLRLVALNALIHDEHVSRRQPEIMDLAARVERSTSVVQQHLNKQNIATRNWSDTEKVLLSFAREAWKNLDPDTVRPADPESQVLDFAAALIGIKGGSRQIESQALRYVAARLDDPNVSPDIAALIHSRAFDGLLESTALSGRGLKAERARDILRRHRLYQAMGRAVQNSDALIAPDELSLTLKGFPDFKKALLGKYAIFQQDGKPWEELYGAGFDPTVVFWTLNPALGPEEPAIAWVYAASSQDSFQNIFFVFTDDLNWEPLEIADNGSSAKSLVLKGIPAAGFSYCPVTRELVLNIPVTITEPSGAVTLSDQWIPRIMNVENSALSSAGTPRNLACPDSIDSVSRKPATP